MVTTELTELEHFEALGYVVMKGVLDPILDLQPVIDEYSDVLDRLAKSWHAEGKLTSDFADLPFGKRLIEVARESEGEYYKYLDISLSLGGIGEESPIHLGSAVFDLLTSPRLLDAVELFIGPEIFSNPVQHVRIKAPERVLPEDKRTNGGFARTQWHQDQGVVIDEADDTNMLTVWIPVLEATEENGCLAVVPASHGDGLALHCDNEIPDRLLRGEPLPLPMTPGDVLFMTKMTQHSSLSNVSDDIRWSFDLRYNPIGEPTGRPWFPGFVARSRANPESVLPDRDAWEALWADARDTLADGDDPKFRRWDPDDPRCA